MTEVSTVEEIYQRLRRTTHDPESISTPQDLLVTMLSAKDRGLELEQQKEVRGRPPPPAACQRAELFPLDGNPQLRIPLDGNPQLRIPGRPHLHPNAPRFLCGMMVA